jgi:hypothetical protein
MLKEEERKEQERKEQDQKKQDKEKQDGDWEREHRDGSARHRRAIPNQEEEQNSVLRWLLRRSQ